MGNKAPRNKSGRWMNLLAGRESESASAYQGGAKKPKKYHNIKNLKSYSKSAFR